MVGEGWQQACCKKGFELGKELRKQSLADNTKEAKEAKSILFNQRAR